MERFDVVIVGAGPAGSSSAIHLSRRGYSVALVDRQPFPCEKLCGDFLNPTNWPLFEELGVADRLLSVQHEKVRVFFISTFLGDGVRVPFPNGLRRFGLGLRRSDLDALLLGQAESEGATVRQGRLATEIRREAGGWSITLGNHSVREKLHGTVLIGADGRNSRVAHRLGSARPSEENGKFVAFQLHLRNIREVKGEVQIHLFPGGYAGLVGLGGDRVNLCFVVEKERATKRSVEALFENCLYENPYLRETMRESDVEGDPRSAYPVYFAPRRSYGDGFLLVGDAARVTEPVTGEGVYFALKGGKLAAEAIDLAFRKADFSAQQLSSYENGCRRAFSRRQRINGLVRALIYRPSWLAPWLWLSSWSSFPIRPLVDFVCGANLPLSLEEKRIEWRR